MISEFYFYPGVFISLILLAATFLAYTCDKQLYNVPRRCLMLFLICLAWLYIAPVIRFARYENVSSVFDFIAMTAAPILTLLWMNVFAFDICWTFKTSQPPTDSLCRFFSYCVYVFGGAALLLLLVFFKVLGDEMECLAFIVLGFAVINVVLLHIGGYRISRIYKASSSFKYPSFEAEVDRQATTVLLDASFKDFSFPLQILVLCSAFWNHDCDLDLRVLQPSATAQSS
jgi:hypothetical protein